MRRSLGPTMMLALLAAAAAAAGLWQLAASQMDAPSPSAVPVRVEVHPGERLRTVLRRLEQQGALRHARLVEWYLRLHGMNVRLQAGAYEIAPHATARATLEQLMSGRVILESLTIVEGWTFDQMRAALDALPSVQHTLRGLPQDQLMRALGHPDESAEGRFFPDTYRFAAGTSDRRILEMAYGRMHDELMRDWNTRAPDLPLTSPEQALVLASIIEKETGREQERPMVAAVFVNRLRSGMRLQSDPTVIYGLGDSYDGSIHTHDLTTDTPYNTYTRAGLPPTPIALPGGASLQAAVHPAVSDALYFVAAGDGSGTHRFSATLAQHDVALRAYLRRLGARPAARGGDAPGSGK